MKRPKPIYAQKKSRFGLGSLVALLFVAVFAVAAIVFGMNALSNNTPAAPVQPVITLDITSTPVALPAAGAATQDAAPTEAIATEAPATTTSVEQSIAPTTLPVTPTVEAAQPTATAQITPTVAATDSAGAVGTGQAITYTVKGGDTCGAIAKQFDITVAEIVELNNLDSRCFLRASQVLTVTK